MQSISSLKTAMQKTLDVLGEDLRTLRPGRASGDLVGTLPVAAYGGTMPLNQVASISANDQGQLIVQPWDKSVVAAIENAIRDSQLGFSVINEGAQLRLSVPPLSQERRAEFVKLVAQKGEAARIQLRQLRGDAMQTANREKTAGTMREDELNRFTKDLNELIDDFNQQVKTLVETKERELMTV
ncbi:MAG: ribosome recycling factor [Candidatus Berkelbacteria bacterium]|nr:MAG: ribosome recycling factor [Candidatus Berkelbacteria bacterium]QQG51545.1 MAG: ribosome recycling factor [Candidatus Berkelbacteria bacterium]